MMHLSSLISLLSRTFILMVGWWLSLKEFLKLWISVAFSHSIFESEEQLSKQLLKKMICSLFKITFDRFVAFLKQNDPNFTHLFNDISTVSREVQFSNELSSNEICSESIKLIFFYWGIIDKRRFANIYRITMNFECVDI